jgi:hypothetical protein
MTIDLPRVGKSGLIRIPQAARCDCTTLPTIACPPHLPRRVTFRSAPVRYRLGYPWRCCGMVSELLT